MSAVLSSRAGVKQGRSQVMGFVAHPSMAAFRIAERLEMVSNVRRGLLVFVDNATVFAVRPDSGMAMRQTAQTLVGFYRGGATAAQIEADLREWRMAHG